MSNKASQKGIEQDSTSELKPTLRFPEFRDAGDWERRKLSDFLFEAKQRNRQLKYGPSEVLSVSGEYGCVNQIKLLGRSYAGVSVKDYHVVETGDIVYTKSPLKRNPYGIIKANKGKPGIVSTLYAVYRTTGICHPDYLDHYFSRDYSLNRYLQPIVRKGAKNDMKVNNAAVLSGEIWAPKLKEQQKITDCLTSLDELLAADGQKLAALRTYKQGLMRQVFPREGETIPRLRFPEFQDEPEWSAQNLGAVASLINERAGNNNCIPMSITSGVGLVSQQEKFGETIAGNQYKNYLVLQKNDFAYNKSATKEFPQGFIAKYSGDEPAAVPNSIFTCFRAHKDEIVPDFLNYLFLGNLHGKWLRKYIEVGARAHGSLSVEDEHLMSLPVPLPSGESSLAEQQKIAQCLTSLDELIAAQAKQIDSLKSHKKGLMQKLFPFSEGFEA
jgi:type I restriction enzyme S subunit